ncbi:MAG: hypothetical protein JWM53_4211 [bacterium]|nr:hypothetical protein [bacterium]
MRRFSLILVLTLAAADGLLLRTHVVSVGRASIQSDHVVGLAGAHNRAREAPQRAEPVQVREPVAAVDNTDPSPPVDALHAGPSPGQAPRRAEPSRVPLPAALPVVAAALAPPAAPLASANQSVRPSAVAATRAELGVELTSGHFVEDVMPAAASRSVIASDVGAAMARPPLASPY